MKKTKKTKKTKKPMTRARRAAVKLVGDAGNQHRDWRELWGYVWERCEDHWGESFAYLARVYGIEPRGTGWRLSVAEAAGKIDDVWAAAWHLYGDAASADLSPTAGETPEDESMADAIRVGLRAHVAALKSMFANASEADESRIAGALAALRTAEACLTDDPGDE